MIEQAYTLGETLGIAVWCEDEAGPYGTAPYAGASWQPERQPAEYPHEYFREGTAKMLTLFHPQSGEVRVKGVTNTRNETLHDWLKDELTAILSTLPAPTSTRWRKLVTSFCRDTPWGVQPDGASPAPTKKLYAHLRRVVLG